MQDTMNYGRAFQALIAFSELRQPQQRGIEHAIVGDELAYDSVNGTCELRVRLNGHVNLEHSQGRSTLDVQINRDDERTTVFVTGAQVLTRQGGDGQTVLLRLKGTVTAIPSPDH
jgi:hypothetical protein